MSESRQELLAWINQVTKLGLSRIEDCGKGYAMLVIMDSIYQDVPLKKVNFECNNDYQYINNWKVLQQVFLRKGIDKVVDPERLSRCKMQDNLEFVQWAKRFWDQYYPGGDYDALARRGGRGLVQHGASPNAPRRRQVSSGSTGQPAPRSSLNTTGAATNNTAAVLRAKQAQQQIANLEGQLLEANETMFALERERDFYFNKLREIEILVQTHLSAEPMSHESMLERIQTILYSTEDGFELPPETERSTDVYPLVDHNMSNVVDEPHMEEAKPVDMSSNPGAPDFVRARLQSLEVDDDDENLTF
ncbi:EB1 family Mal3 [Schizosaccharomyces cryophilus OY26]|uniref:EB1 family Mal3 n=1 Tax=Schizosaccharomyces cryophilus (strain OY26 / ATCC MYA-4695 / CBS 11777 / NBRC 106824 / NRRL Y48691) TaxID=653667 RepID=S9VZU9_SCHCR|nr:EB1 family Mal3 [Schizosaccharomyces cryophilus OY26]EPY51794.1 EB1 family Mal3 [Schizosaccharomyces cryophilus OY26]